MGIMKSCLRLSLMIAAAAALSLSVGCASPVGTGGGAPGASESGGFSGMTVPAAGSAPTAGIVLPAEPAFDTPREAVESYLAWVAFAYEMADSDVATMSFSPAEEVRVNSYVQLNKEKGQRIRQRLLSFSQGQASMVGTITLVPARERWDYQYLELTSARSVSTTYSVSYDVTYTLVPRDEGGWIVDAVEATPLGHVK